MQFWTFASGSSGNCFLVESEGTRLLVECGRTEDVFTAPREHLTEDYVTGRFG